MPKQKTKAAPRSKLSQYRVLIAGILSPPAAMFLYAQVYTTLTARSTDHEHDWLFRLSASTLAMTLPFFITLALVIADYRSHKLALSAKFGLAIAILSLGLTYQPVSDGIKRTKQTRNQALHDVTAPAFNTPDILGNQQRLADQKGKVVLINIWATWCGPCRAEMPALDQLYRQRKDQGFIIFGISDESVDVQRNFLDQVPVSYPLLTLKGDVPNLYRDIARYPALFLIDRQGRLQPAPTPEQPFENIVAAVDDLLKTDSR